MMTSDGGDKFMDLYYLLHTVLEGIECMYIQNDENTITEA